MPQILLKYPPPLSKDFSIYLKGGAIGLMLIAHLISSSQLNIGSVCVFTGISCLAFYAFLSGYAHALMSEKYPDKPALLMTGKSFWLFYKKYLICCALLIPVQLLSAKINIADTALILVPIKPNLVTDSWWYVFCYMVLCFVIFPFIRTLDRATGRAFFITSFILTVMLILLPMTFTMPFMPADFKNMWGSIPVLRTIMVIPYYLTGYAYYKHIRNPEKLSGVLTMLPLLFFTVFPFSAYGIAGISAINIGLSFIICAILLRLMYGISLIKLSLTFIGTHSVYMWLLHMPIYICYTKLPLPQNFGIRFPIVFTLALLGSIFLTAISKHLDRWFSYRKAPAD
ncbi:MAG: acyltransferase family protein [Akkermansia sp.]|nr:acyltransferase family protein [Akkermansia sp.]